MGFKARPKKGIELVKEKIVKAIENQKMQREPLTISYGTWGVWWNGTTWTVEDERAVCCPMGAVLLEYQPAKLEGYEQCAATSLGIETRNVNDFIDGFDGLSFVGRGEKEFHDLGVELRRKYTDY